MAVLPAQTIRQLCVERAMVAPFSERGMCHGMTYGLGPCTYDLRIAQDVVLLPVWMFPLWVIIKMFAWMSPVVHPARVYCGFGLASTMERVCFPDDVCGTVLDKSSWARRGLAVQNTKFDPGFEGYPTIELSNHGHRILWIDEGTPICQFKFERLEAPTDMPYSGRYQDQASEPTPYRAAKGTWE